MDIIDTLVLRFGLDNTGFKQKAAETRKEIDATKKAGNQAAQELAEGFLSAAKSALAFFGVVASATALKDFIDDTTKANAALERFAENIGVSTSTISAWGAAVARQGGSADAFQGTLANLSRTITEIQVTGQSGMLPYLRALGVHIADANGHALGLDQILLQLADSFSRIDRTKAYNIAKMMGLDEGTINLLISGRKAVEDNIKRQKEFGTVTKEDGERAIAFRNALSDLRQQSAQLGRDFLSVVLPPLTRFLEWLGKVGRWMAENKAFVIGFFVGLAAVIGVTLLPVLTSAAIALWALIGPFVAVGVAAAALGVALGLLADDWYTWLHGGKSALADFWQYWADVWKAIKATFQGTVDDIRATFNSLLEAAKNFWRLIVAIFTGSPEEIRSAGKKFGDSFVQGIKDSIETAKQAWKDVKNFFAGGTPEAKKTVETTTRAVTAAANAVANQVDNVVTAVVGKRLPRSVRNNNPGNLNFAGQAGATKEGGAGGRFAVFGSTEEGVSALSKQLRRYAQRGKDTIRSIVTTYAPASENNTAAYIASLSKQTGIGPDEKLNLDDAATMKGLIRGISRHEAGGSYLTEAQISGGLALSSRATAGGKVAAAAPAGGGKSAPQTVTIDQINIHTQATDAAGIAREIGPALKNRGIIGQAENGIS